MTRPKLQRGNRGKRPPPGTKLRLLEAARERVRAGKAIHDLRLTDLAAACRVTRAAAAFHYPEGIRGVVAGLAIAFAVKLLATMAGLPSPKRKDSSVLPAVGRAVLAALRADPANTVAFQYMRCGWQQDTQDPVSKLLNTALDEIQKRLPPALSARLVLGVAEFFFGEVRRGAMSVRVAERSLVDTLERIAAP
jgi:AcrR family transcriptional regulator